METPRINNFTPAKKELQYIPIRNGRIGNRQAPSRKIELSNDEFTSSRKTYKKEEKRME